MAVVSAVMFLPERRQTDGVGGDGDNYLDCAFARRVINSGMLGSATAAGRHPLSPWDPAHACHFDVFIQI